MAWQRSLIELSPVDAGALLLIRVPALVVRHAQAPERLGFNEQHPPTECHGALGEEKGLFRIDSRREPGLLEEALLLVDPVGRESDPPAAREMLASGADVGVDVGLLRQGWLLGDSGQAAGSIRIGVEFVEELVERDDELLLAGQRPSNDLFERSRSACWYHGVSFRSLWQWRLRCGR